MGGGWRLLIGDAAHAMNPHASKGACKAMVDAVTVADLIPGWLKHNTFSAAALRAFEITRRPQVSMLQTVGRRAMSILEHRQSAAGLFARPGLSTLGS